MTEETYDIKDVAHITRVVFTDEAELSGTKLKDLRDDTLIATPESAVAMMIEGYFSIRYAQKLENISPSRIFMKVLNLRHYKIQDALNIIKSSKADSLEFLIESNLKFEGFDKPDFRDIAEAISRYNQAFPLYGRW